LPELIEGEFAVRPGDVKGMSEQVPLLDDSANLRFECIDRRFHGGRYYRPVS